MLEAQKELEQSKQKEKALEIEMSQLKIMQLEEEDDDQKLGSDEEDNGEMRNEQPRDNGNLVDPHTSQNTKRNIPPPPPLIQRPPAMGQPNIANFGNAIPTYPQVPVYAYANPGGGGVPGPGVWYPPPPQQPSSSDAAIHALVNAFQNQNRTSQQMMSRPLPVFTGNPLEWPLFEAHYNATTRQCGFSMMKNWERLQASVKGEARETVQSLLLLPGNADAIMQRLKQRYGRTEYVIQSLVEVARKCPAIKENKLASILDYSNAINNMVTTVQALQEPAYLQNPTLLQELVEKLPDSMKREWGKRRLHSGMGNSLIEFSQWISEEAEGISYVVIPTFTQPDGKKKGKASDPAFAAAITEDRRDSNCYACEKPGHRVYSCPDLKKMSVDDRWTLVKKRKLCFCCLQPGCSKGDCKSKRECGVDGCTRQHNRLLHGSKPPARKPERRQDNSKQAPENKSEELPEIVVETNAHITERANSVLLRIIPVKLQGPGGAVVINALSDECSTVTLIHSSISRQLNLGGSCEPLKLNWTNGSSQVDYGSRKVSLEIGPVKNGVRFPLAGARTVKNLDLPAQSVDFVSLVKAYSHFKGLKLFHMTEVKPLMLIGQPHIHLTLPRVHMMGKPNEPIATKCQLGWAVHGNIPGDGGVDHSLSVFHETDADIMHRLVKESFSLESVGIKSYASNRSREDTKAEQIMEIVTRRVGVRFETGLLWRKEPGVGDNPALPPSYDAARRRLLGLERRMRKDALLRGAFSAKIQEYVGKGYARRLEKEEARARSPKEWFLPIFPVFNPNKPGKLRIVFDAASKSNGKSLNDFLFTGPDLLVSLPGLLLNFRLRRVGYIGDITDMFHQVQIREVDKPAQRFLWRESEDEEIAVYELQVMMFGAVCSPYCAQYVKNLNASELKSSQPAAADTIIRKHYMDDCMQSKDTIAEAVADIRDVMEIHHRGGFHIGKWISNSVEVLETVKPEDRAANAKDLAGWSEIPTERALGLHWDPKEDVFVFKLNLDRAGQGIATGEAIPTKTDILRLIMLVWDPLGFLNNHMIKARIILQQLWRTGLGWNDQIPAEIFAKWKSWVKKLPQLKDVPIPRCFSNYASSSSDIQLHVFADASEVAHCAVAYLRIGDGVGSMETAFIMSKVRVTPMKPTSIPKLELQAALIASRLGKFVQENLEVPIKSVFYWSDSSTVLKWIRNEAQRFQQFVSNRIGEIHENSEVSNWRWVPTQYNTADDGTREGKCDLSMDNKWWTGPDFLKLPEEEWPVEPMNQDVAEECLELRKEFAAVAIESPSFTGLPDIGRFSKYSRLIRSTAYVVLGCKALCGKPELRPFPIVKAMTLLIKRSQWEDYSEEMQSLNRGEAVAKSSRIYKLSPMIDDDGVLRMKSRLTSAEQQGIRQPVILHPKNPFTKLLIANQHKEGLHQGEEFVRNELRQLYWIPHIRTAIRSVIRNCLECKIRKVTAQPPLMGNLPDFRIQPQSRPFTIVGMDYFGPLEVTEKRSTIKVYGVIFTCLTTRAVHLEIASDLSADACIMAVRRMIATRGDPQVIWSDNGTNMKGAAKELKDSIAKLNQERMKEELTVKGIDWRFIPPASPHFGATWERLVRSVKTSLCAIMMSRAPTFEVLHTAFKEVEKVLNSRPLTEVATDPEAPAALTPFHFLIGTSSASQPPGVFKDGDLQLRVRWKQVQALTNMFWKRWVKEYVPTLQKRTKWHERPENVKVGDVVIVLDKTLQQRRGSFPVGVIVKASVPEDGIVRVVDVKTSTGIYTRPVVKIGRLGINSGGGDGGNPEGFEGDDVAGDCETPGKGAKPEDARCKELNQHHSTEQSNNQTEPGRTGQEEESGLKQEEESGLKQEEESGLKPEEKKYDKRRNTKSYNLREKK